MKGYNINLLLNKINEKIKKQLAQFIIKNVLHYSGEYSIHIVEETLGVNNGNDLFPFMATISVHNKSENIIFDNAKRRKEYSVKANQFVYIEIGKKINVAESDGRSIIIHIDINGLNSDKLLFQYKDNIFEFSKIDMDSIEGDDVIKIYSQILYKYKSFEEYTGTMCSVPKFTKNAIDNDELYFSLPKDLNDPFECRFDNVLPFVTVAFNVFSSLNEADRKKHGFKKIYDELIKYYNLKGSYTDFKAYYLSKYGLTDSTDSSLTINPDDYKICALTPHYDEILMWSYYGQEHKGVCLEYDAEKIIKALKKDPSAAFFLYGSIKYDNDRPTYNKLSSLYYYLGEDVIINLLIINVLFKKYEKWAHENEFRFVIVDKSTDAGRIIQVPINGFYLGCNSNTSLVHTLKNSSKFHSPQASVDLTDYKLNF